MAQRHDDALYIQQGACNPAGISRTLTRAVDEAVKEGAYARHDPAVRLIVHQLCHVCGIVVEDYHLQPPPGILFDWVRDYDACKRLASDGALRSMRLTRPTGPVSEVKEVAHA